MGHLKEMIRKQYDVHGSSLPQHASQAVYDELQNPGKLMAPGDDIRVGGFAFLLYDLAGASSRMEQYSPVLVCGTNAVMSKKYLWGLSLNFIPTNIRIVFFDQLFANYGKTLEHNAKSSSISKEKVLADITFESMYKALQSIGYEYALRQFDMSKINNFYNVSTNFLDLFLTFDTRRFTGVDEGKLMEIWMAKLDAQEERHQKMMMKLYNDYDLMAETLVKELDEAKNLHKNLERTAKTLQKIQRDI